MSQRSKNTRQKGNSSQNEHIPKYIKSQPWFYESANSQDYLIHHRQSQDKKKLFDIENNQDAKVGLGITDKKIVNNSIDSVREKKRCENCGQLGHWKKDCLERPRKFKKKTSLITASQSDVTIRDEEYLDWDAKKDRWFGYTGEDYDKVVTEWEQKTTTTNDDPEEAIYDKDEEIELYKLGLIKDSKGLLKQRELSEQERNLGRTTVRLREDKAAYLNDINSSDLKYDPKSRIYKSETMGYIDEKSKMFRRHLTGEGLQLEQLAQFTRQHARNEGIKDATKDSRKLDHVLIANPTKYEKLMKESEEEAKTKSLPKPGKDYSKLEAQKIEGKKQDPSTKKTLETMYD